MRREIESPLRPKGNRESEIDMTAERLVLAPENLSNKTVRGYLGVFRDVVALGRQFDAESKHPQTAILTEHPMEVAYRRVEAILKAEETMLKHGFVGNTTLEVRKYINNAVLASGMNALSLDNVVVATEAPEGVWEKKSSEISTKVLDLKLISPTERTDTFHKGRVGEEGKALGFAEESLWHPPYHAFLTMLIDTKTLLHRQERMMELPVEPGLTPAVDGRMRSVSHLTRAALMVLEESMEEPLDKMKFARELNLGLAAYGTRIVPTS